MVHFVGAGPGAPDLITRRGAALLADADCIIYAGSLVNPALLGLAKPGCAIYNSAEMTLEQVLDTIRAAEKAGGTTVRLHTGDPCLYGAIREQMDALDADGIPYDDTPGVSSFCGAAAALCAEYTLPNVSQTVIITRMEGRTPVPEAEQLAKLAAHGATMVIFLSIGLVDKVQQALLESGGGPPPTPPRPPAGSAYPHCTRPRSRYTCTHRNCKSRRQQQRGCSEMLLHREFSRHSILLPYRMGCAGAWLHGCRGY